MATYENATCHTVYMCASVCVSVCVGVRDCARVYACAHVCASCVWLMRKHPFQDFRYLLSYTALSGAMWDYLHMILCASGVVACGAFDQAIQIVIVDRRSSLK